MENTETKVDTATDNDKEESLATMTKTELINLVNSVTSIQLKRAQKKAAPKDEVEEESEEAPKKKAGKKEEEESEAAILRKELDAMKAERRAEKLEAKQKEVFAEVKSTLTGKIKPEALNAAMKVLKADGNISIKKSGDVVFKFDGEEYDSVEEGLEVWLKSDEAKLFITSTAPGYGKNKGTKASYPFPNKGTSQGSNVDGNLSAKQKTEAQLAQLGLKLGLS